jgi:hypothetical protein
MSKELKWCKQFIKCSILSWYHKKKRVRKKNRNRVVEMFSYIDCFLYFVKWKKGTC